MPAPAQALTITVLLGHSRLRWHQEEWRCSHWCWEQRYTAIPSMGQQNGAPCTARFLPCAENARVSCPAVTPKWRGSMGLPQVCQGSQDFSLQSSLTPTACAFPTQAFPPLLNYSLFKSWCLPEVCTTRTWPIPTLTHSPKMGTRHIAGFLF